MIVYSLRKLAENRAVVGSLNLTVLRRNVRDLGGWRNGRAFAPLPAPVAAVVRDIEPLALPPGVPAPAQLAMCGWLIGMGLSAGFGSREESSAIEVCRIST